MLKYLPVIVGLAVSAVLIPFVKRFAKRLEIISSPTEDRWHKKPTPLLGGIVIYISTVTSFLLFKGNDFHSLSLILAGTVIFFLGAVDDFRHLTPPIKLIVEISVAVAFILFTGIKWDIIGNIPLDIFITVIWLVGITNAFNLLDNMDGLSAGIAIISGSFIFLYLFSNTHTSVSSLLLSLIGAIAGFLIYNFNPASIFMGDSGSLFIGFMLGSIVLVPEVNSPAQLLQIILFPVLIFLIPIFDTIYVVFMRKLSGLDAMKGGKDHTSHRLVKIGLSERSAVLLLYTVGILSGIIAFFERSIPIYIYIEALFLFILFLLFLGIYLSKIKVHDANKNEKGVVSVIVNITYKRRIIEILLDLILIFVSFYGAYILRFEGQSFYTNSVTMFQSLPLILGLQIIAFYTTGVYKAVWKYTGVTEIWIIIKGIVIGTIFSMLGILFIWRFNSYSRTVFIIYAILLFILMTFSRYVFKSFDLFLKRSNGKNLKKVLIYGAGDGGEFALNELLNNEQLELMPVCFIDDDKIKHGRSIHNYPVIGGIEKLEDVITHYSINEVIISTPKIKDSRLEKIKSVCKNNGIRLRIFSLKLEE
ncbi:MAG: hypothetical protein M1381_04625 [Deltaproteobacteria bacterium]|nr:hypothetical protein [Deltaproteobacteria bacterium]MCL5792083.1 hypothetical protein [Deltaproteobacteria bacterium]